MESSEIYSVLQQHECLQKHYGGILPSDKLPEKLVKGHMENNIYYVINLDPSDKPGSHWVACFVNKRGPNSYFDSYGYPPTIDSIKDFVGENFNYNTKQVQHPLSTACGQWCIFWILHTLLKGKIGNDVPTFQARFDKHDLLKNDHEINTWINNCFGTTNKVIAHDFLNSQIARALIHNRAELPHLYD